MLGPESHFLRSKPESQALVKTRNDRAAATRAKLLTAARDSFLERGFARSTFRDISKAAGFSTGAAFAHWSDKGEFFTAATGMPGDPALFAARIADLLEGGESFEAKRIARDYALFYGGKPDDRRRP